MTQTLEAELLSTVDPAWTGMIGWQIAGVRTWCMVDSACVFCEIIEDREPAHIAWADDHVVAFLDRVPLFKGHVLVVPRTHVVNLEDLPPTEIEPLFTRVQVVSAAMTAELGAAGSFVAMNNTVSQSVPHLHVHVVPRNPKDGLRGFFWPRTKYDDGDEMAAMAKRLRTWLEPRMTELTALGLDRKEP